MPNIKSAAKRMRSSSKRKVLNQEVLSRLKNLFRKFEATTTSQDTSHLKQQADLLVREYDRAASRGIIPKGRADRKKSRITLALNQSLTKK